MLLYDQLWLYYNLFQPVMHMVEKEVAEGKLRRKHDQAMPPYQRLLSSGILSAYQKARLASLYTGTNHRQLRNAIYDAIENLRVCSEISSTIDRKEAAFSGNIFI